MNHAMKHTTACIAGFLLILTTLCPGRVYAEPPENTASLETITATLQQWRDAFVNVQFTCTSTTEYSAQMARKEEIEGVLLRREYEWAWTDSGMRRRHTVDYRNGHIHNRSMRLVDGTTRYSVTFPARGPSSVDAPSEILTAPAQVGESAVVIPLFGLWNSKMSQWLPEVLPSGELIDPLNEGGRVYPKLRVPNPRVPNFYLYVILDPEHGFLPRSAYTGFGSGKKSKVQFRQTVTAFQQLEGGIWFPAAGEFLDVIDGETTCTEKWKMTEVQVNHEISKKLFQPKLPAGTPVKDLVTGKTKFDGSRDKRRELESKRVAEAQENLVNRVGGEAEVSAQPVRGWSSVTYYVLFAIAAISLVTAFKIKRSTG